MKKLSILALAALLMAATVRTVFDDLEMSEDKAKEYVIASFGGGFLSSSYEVLKLAKAMPTDVKVASTRQLIKFAKEYTKSPDFQKKYTKWRNERLGYKSKKFGLPSITKALDNAVDKQLNKADDEKKYPANANDLIKKRLEKFLALSATVDFDAQLNGSMFANPEYESKPGEWKAIFRAGKDVVTVAREEAQTWLKELE